MVEIHRIKHNAGFRPVIPDRFKKMMGNPFVTEDHQAGIGIVRKQGMKRTGCFRCGCDTDTQVNQPFPVTGQPTAIRFLLKGEAGDKDNGVLLFLQERKQPDHAQRTTIHVRCRYPDSQYHTGHERPVSIRRKSFSRMGNAVTGWLSVTDNSQQLF